MLAALLLLAGCGCEHDGEIYRVGDSRAASCNTCTCELGGGWSCTLIGCTDTSDCPVASGDVFGSVEEHECGLTADSGVAMCHWRITFDAGTWSWQYSDVGESGTWWCDGTLVNASTDAGTRLTVSWDATTEQLTWQDVAYARVAR